MFSGGQPTLSATGVILAQDGWTFDRDLPVFDPQIPESDSGVTQVVFETRLSEAFGSSQTLSLTTADSTAIAGRDYVATRGNITFLAGQTVAFIAVDVLGDTDEGMMEPFSLVVASDAPIVDGIRDGAGIATIRDDDTGLPVLSIEAATATEGEALHFDVILSEPPLVDITFTYRTVADGSALSDIDYGEVLANATIPAGQAMVHVVVDIIEDTLIEDAETFSLNMNSAANVFSTADASGAATILNDDANGQNTTGSAAGEIFNGTSAADVLNRPGGSDSIFGGGMDDTINGANSNDPFWPVRAAMN